MATWGMMTELAGVLVTWALINVLFVSFFLFGGWRRDRFVRVSAPANPSATRGFRRRGLPWETR
jgi:hypothetical protein